MFSDVVFKNLNQERNKFKTPAAILIGIRGVSFHRNCGAASVGEYNRII